jgi:hypothetical protein
VGYGGAIRKAARVLATIFGNCVALGGAPAVRAEEPITVVVEPRPAPWREVWAGSDITLNSWSLYTGTTLAPFAHLDADGWRLRMVAGYGEYRFAAQPSRASGSLAFSDLLIGYQIAPGFRPGRNPSKTQQIRP